MRRTRWFGSVGAALILLGCGADGGGGGGQGGGGGGSGGGGGGGGSATVCHGLEGAYQLAVVESGELPDGIGPWLLLSEGDGSCAAVVAEPWYDGRAYDVSWTGDAAVLQPVSAPAEGGWDQRTSFARWEWNRLQLDLTPEGALAGTVQADLHHDFWAEDYGNPSDVVATLSVEASTSAPELRIAPHEWGDRANPLPWEEVIVESSRPLTALGALLVPLSGEWDAWTDVVPPDTVGVRSARTRYNGSWDAVRGSSAPVAWSSAPVDLVGATVAAPVSIEVEDIGPALAEHTFDSLSVAAWGGAVLTEPAGRMVVGRVCDPVTGIAGQLLTAGKSEVTFSLLKGTLPGDPPAYGFPEWFEIEVVGASGAAATVLQAPNQPWSPEPETVARFGVQGEERVRFTVRAGNTCYLDARTSASIDSITAQ